MDKDKTIRFVSWDEYLSLISKLADKLNPYDFDQILAIGRGGIMLGDALSRIFRRPLDIIMVRSYVNSNKSNKIEYSTMATFFEHYGRFLIVDDLVDSGETIELVTEKIKELTPKPAKSACLWKKVDSKITPDFFVELVPSDIWLQQPFEIWGEHDYLRADARGKLWAPSLPPRG